MARFTHAAGHVGVVWVDSTTTGPAVMSRRCIGSVAWAPYWEIDIFSCCVACVRLSVGGIGLDRVQ